MAQVSPRPAPALCRFEALDAWRGICALLVAFFHAPFYDPFRDLPALDNLEFCVDVFFVLSGFVLMHGYGARLMTGAAVRRFTIVRLGRLWPLHVIVLTAFVLIEGMRFAAARHGGGIAFVLPPFGPGRSPGDIVDNLLMLQGDRAPRRGQLEFPGLEHRGRVLDLARLRRTRLALRGRGARCPSRCWRSRAASRSMR